MPKPRFENIGIGTRVSIKADTYIQNMIDVPLHFHPEYEIVFVLKGRGKLYVSGAETDFCEGQLFFIGGNVAHLFEDENIRTGKQAPSKVVVIQFTEKLFERLWDLPEFDQIRYFLSQISRGIKVEDVASESELVLSMVAAEGIDKFNKLITLLDHIIKSKKYSFIGNEQFISDVKNAAAIRLQKLNLFITVNYSRDITIDQAAHLLRIQKSSLCRFLKKETGKTFSEHVNDFRVRQACKMLRESSKNIAEVCYASGFNNQAYFYRQFKKIIKQSPMDYRLKRKIRA